MNKKLVFRLYIVFFLLSIGTIQAQNSSKNILKSTDISEIKKFIKECHPDDPRKNILKKKLTNLKNAQWMKPGHGGGMEKRTIEPSIRENSEALEKEEFDRLIKKTSIEHKEKTVSLLNNMFTNNEDKNEAIILFRNHTSCNLIIRIEGSANKTLGVSAKGENFIILPKAEYTIKSNVCGNRYERRKVIEKNVMIDLKIDSKNK